MNVFELLKKLNTFFKIFLNDLLEFLQSFTKNLQFETMYSTYQCLIILSLQENCNGYIYFIHLMICSFWVSNIQVAHILLCLRVCALFVVEISLLCLPKRQKKFRIVFFCSCGFLCTVFLNICFNRFAVKYLKTCCNAVEGVLCLV